MAIIILCNQCGNAVGEMMDFCSECGAKVRSAPNAQVFRSPPTHEGPGNAVAGTGFGYAPGTQPAPSRLESLAPDSTARSPQSSRDASPGARLIAPAVIILFIVGGFVAWLAIKDRVRGPTENGSGVTSTQSNSSPSLPQRGGSVVEPAVAEARAAAPSQREEVISTLQAWAGAVKNHDLDSPMSHFADTLDTFYSARNVSSDRIRSTQARAFARYSSLDLQISNIDIAFDSSTTVVATFDKAWNFQGYLSQKPWSGSVREVLRLRKVSGRWLIIGLRDL